MAYAESERSRWVCSSPASVSTCLADANVGLNITSAMRGGRAVVAASCTSPNALATTNHWKSASVLARMAIDFLNVWPRWGLPRNLNQLSHFQSPSPLRPKLRKCRQRQLTTHH